MSALRSIVRFSIQPGRTEEFLELATQCVDYVADEEPDVLEYDWHLDEDTGLCWINELYASSDAFLAHLKSEVGTDLLPRILAIADMTSATVFGEPSEKVAGVLAKLKMQSVGAPTVGIERDDEVDGDDD